MSQYTDTTYRYRYEKNWYESVLVSVWSSLQEWVSVSVWGIFGDIGIGVLVYRYIGISVYQYRLNSKNRQTLNLFLTEHRIFIFICIRGGNLVLFYKSTLPIFEKKLFLLVIYTHYFVLQMKMYYSFAVVGLVAWLDWWLVGW